MRNNLNHFNLIEVLVEIDVPVDIPVAAPVRKPDRIVQGIRAARLARLDQDAHRAQAAGDPAEAHRLAVAHRRVRANYRARDVVLARADRRFRDAARLARAVPLAQAEDAAEFPFAV